MTLEMQATAPGHTPGRYTLLVPRLDTTGPTNLAVDLANGMAIRGRMVRLLYLSGVPERIDVDPLVDVRQFRWSDVLATPGIVHSHGFRPDLVASLMSLLGQSMAVTTLHGHFPLHLAFDYSPRTAALAWWVWRLALSRFARIICLSMTMHRFYKHSFRPERLVTAYNFRAARRVDSEVVEAATAGWIALQRDRGRRVLVFVGSLTRRKNIVPLVRAVAGLGDVALIVCGRGPDLAEIEALGKTAGGRIRTTGHVADVQSIIACCDLLVLPSRAEGLSLAALEAGQVGVPLLLSNIAVHRELAAMGLGTTFDHRRFRDFEAKVSNCKDLEPARRERIIGIWAAVFSAEVGLSCYLKIVRDLELEYEDLHTCR